MNIELTIKNYRCFPDSRPARITLRKGFTALIGVNNSGKSSLLKFFYEFRSVFKLLSQVSGDLLDVMRGRRRGLSLPQSVFDPEEVFCNANDRDLEIEVNLVGNNEWVVMGGPPIANRLTLSVQRSGNAWLAELQSPDGAVKIPEGSQGMDGTVLVVNGKPIADIAGISAAFKALTETLYIGPFRNAINIGSNTAYFDIQVGQAFVEAWRTFKMGKIKKHNEAAYRLTQDIKHIFGFEELEINPSEDGQTLQVFINGRSYKLHELGSGMTQFILVLANVATKQPSYVLIDEPELNLHPSLQLDFLTTLSSHAREGVVFGTQSIGLARASAERIYSIRKIGEGESQVTDFESTARLSEFLGELSFSGYRELGFNSILLVEGVNDVKTVQQFLRLYNKDHEVVLLPLGGAQFINKSREAELEEIKRISENVYALIDSERTSAGAALPVERAWFVEACQKAKTSCHVVQRRAIENYFSDRAVKAVKGEKYSALQPYQARNEVSPVWSKSENWQIAREMTLDELKTTDLGQFLESLSVDQIAQVR